MAKAMLSLPSGSRVVEVPELPNCPAWCEGVGEYPCWGHDLDDAWTVSHATSFGGWVSVVQTGRWTPSSGLIMDAAFCTLSDIEDSPLSRDHLELLIHAIGDAGSLMAAINPSS